ncbi:hypothetical protein [uncultured Prevotella sp.]|uniref:tetratricopeptide repeat protein n=1 Tax=uncultured Prevotella sp. TaxID=159272 RepID=UPI0027E26297|nr:hypothetical protein [uncultured Prevotella sp.]
MKKFFIMAMLAVAATSTYAQDIKSVLKAKDYAEAQSQLNSCLSSLSNEEKAKAYNKLVELSMQKVNKENSTIVENQALQQMGQQAKPVDMQGFYTSLTNALNAAQECDKYDHMPNAKGKVSPKFHKKNQATLWTLRPQLINAGQDCLQKDDNKGALAYYAAYVESGNSSLFADMDKTKAPDTYLGEVARVASVIAFQEKDMETANKYCDVALKDTASYKDALNLKMAMMQQQMKTKEDSVKCLKTFEELYANDKNNESIFTNLATLYGNLGMKAEQDKCIQERLAADPKCFVAWAVKGQAEMNASKWDEAIADFKKAIEIKPSALVMTWMGYCNNNKAANLQDVNQQKVLLAETEKYLEKAKELDPEQKEANWKYLLYNTYYVLYGADDARTKSVAP